MIIQREHCFLCGLMAQMGRPANQDAYKVVCQRCDTYLITRSLSHALDISNITDEDIKLYHYLPAYTRQMSERGTISELDTKNWRDFARKHQVTQVTRKLALLLEMVASRSSYPGDEALIDAELDYPLLDAGSANEVEYLLDDLCSHRS